MIKMIATDIDGTIFEWNSGFSPAVKECMAKLKKAGVKVVLVTGRMHSSAIHAANELNLGTPVISYQGALIKDIDNSTLFQKTLKPETAKKLIKWARENKVHINLYLDDKLYVEEVSADQGPTMKRWRAGSRGSASLILKRSSHVGVTLKEKE